MTYDRRELRVVGLLDNYGGPQEAAAARAWNQFVAAVRELAKQPPYNAIIPNWGIDTDEADETDYEMGDESPRHRARENALAAMEEIREKLREAGEFDADEEIRRLRGDQ